MKKKLFSMLVLAILVLGIATAAYAFDVYGDSGIYRPYSSMITMWAETRTNVTVNEVYAVATYYKDGDVIDENSALGKNTDNAYTDLDVPYASGFYEVEGFHIAKTSYEVNDWSYASQTY